MMKVINLILKVFGISILPRKTAVHGLALQFALISVQIDGNLSDIISMKELKRQVQVFEEVILKS